MYPGYTVAPWPRADFIVGNPPYLGQARQRDAFGDGYVDALRRVYTTLPDSVDFVMYWWHRAAQAVATGDTMRAGLITTSSITQTWNRDAIASAIDAGVSVLWAIPDHPWVDDTGSADVRVALTVLSATSTVATRLDVDEEGRVLHEHRAPRLNADLTAHADVAGAAETRLLSNRGLAAQGLGLRGNGFLLGAMEARALLDADPRNARVLRPYRNGRDIAARPRHVHVIDFGMMTEDEARAYPALFDIVRTRVKPDRDAHARESIRRYWWRHGWPRVELREAAAGLSRFIVTVGTAKHRFFTFLDASFAPDEKLICVGSDDAFVLGVLSSRVHMDWALAAGGRLGVGNDPVYVKSTCFDPFPFPLPSDDLRRDIAVVAERLDTHRHQAVARDPIVTMTMMYNVVEKLRTGEPLTVKERSVHDSAACGVLRELHDDLDHLVARAYGWSWPEPSAVTLERLVSLHDARVEEESRGHVRWVRPEYQGQRYGSALVVVDAVEDSDALHTAAAPAASTPSQTTWPSDAIGQITVLRGMAAVTPLSVDDAIQRLSGARRDIVHRHLETLALLGEVRTTTDGRYAIAAGVL